MNSNRARLLAPGGLIDIGPFRTSKPFTRLWLGSSFSSLGAQLSQFATIYQCWEITHSTIAVGEMGLAFGVPRLLLSPYGGSIADRLDRRRVVLISGVASILTALGMTLQSALHNQHVWVLYVLLAVTAVISSISGPARATFVSVVLERDQIPAGVALTQLSRQIAAFVGPAMGGWIASYFSVTGCYAVDAISYTASMYGVYRLTATPGEDRRAGGLGGVIDGLKYMRREPVIAASLLIDLSAVLLAMPTAVLPELNSTYFGGSARTLGYLMSSMAVGGVLSGALMRLVSGRRRVGAAQIWSALTWGVAVALAGYFRSLPVLVCVLAVAGASDSMSVMARAIIVQLAAKREFRGRVNSVSQSFAIAGPSLGNYPAGLMATWFGAESTLIIGGAAAVIALGLVVARFPQLWKYSTDVKSDSLPESPGSASAVTKADGVQRQTVAGRRA